MTTPQHPHGPLRSFGRLKARPLKARQAALFDTLMPSVAVAASGPVMASGETWLEIGFGGGEHLAAQAARHPAVAFIGAEPFVNGVASALRHLEEGGLQNVRLFQGDARELIARIPDACITRVFILFPDPWPKARHHKRRLIQPEFIADLARVMAPGARLRFATDVQDYADQGRAVIDQSPDFAAVAGDPCAAPTDHITTRYEEKKLGDIAPVWFDWTRR
jgi:tRNA (guanine-N7-)-methyltransferase